MTSKQRYKPICDICCVWTDTPRCHTTIYLYWVNLIEYITYSDQILTSICRKIVPKLWKARTCITTKDAYLVVISSPLVKMLIIFRHFKVWLISSENMLAFLAPHYLCFCAWYNSLKVILKLTWYLSTIYLLRINEFCCFHTRHKEVLKWGERQIQTEKLMFNLTIDWIVCLEILCQFLIFFLSLSTD